MHLKYIIIFYLFEIIDSYCTSFIIYIIFYDLYYLISFYVV